MPHSLFNIAKTSPAFIKKVQNIPPLPLFN